jgi:hypothetical protein
MCNDKAARIKPGRLFFVTIKEFSSSSEYQLKHGRDQVTDHNAEETTRYQEDKTDDSHTVARIEM